MPNATVKSFAQKYGKSVGEVEKLWDKAVKIASEDFGKPEASFDSREYAYVTGILKNMLSAKEGVSVRGFLKSTLSAREFIETMTSLGPAAVLDHPVTPPDSDEEPRLVLKGELDMMEGLDPQTLNIDPFTGEEIPPEAIPETPPPGTVVQEDLTQVQIEERIFQAG